jgi:hypothetical protein
MRAALCAVGAVGALCGGTDELSNLSDTERAAISQEWASDARCSKHVADFGDGFGNEVLQFAAAALAAHEEGAVLVVDEVVPPTLERELLPKWPGPLQFNKTSVNCEDHSGNFWDPVKVQENQAQLRSIFSWALIPALNVAPTPAVTSSTLVVHIRSADVFDGDYGDSDKRGSDSESGFYYQPPLCMYTNIINRGKYKDVLVVTNDVHNENPVVGGLQNMTWEDPGTVVTIQRGTFRQDASTILAATNLVMACSTFSWMFSLMSHNLRRLHYLAGKDCMCCRCGFGTDTPATFPQAPYEITAHRLPKYKTWWASNEGRQEHMLATDVCAGSSDS